MSFLLLNRFIGAIFLISGTSIGAGMLGLPIRTIGINIILIFFIFFVIWFITVCASLSILEISLWIPGETNIISITNFVINKYAGFFVGFIYILFMYALIAAYISGGTFMIVDLLSINCSSLSCSLIYCLVFTLPFFLMTLFGFNFSDYVNRFFLLFLCILYLIILLNLYNFSDLNIKKFDFLNYNFSVFSFPIILTSFGYSLLIPSLKIYLFNNVKLIFFSILFGSLIPFFVYIFWEYFVYCFLFNVSSKLFIQTLFGYGNPAEKLIILIGNNNVFILYIISFFSLSALISSLIGVSLSLYYFFIDLFKMSCMFFLNRLLCVALVYIIPLLFSLFYPYGFMYFLTYAGIIASFLLVIFPVYVVWYGRYIKGFSYKRVLFGGRFILFILFLFGALFFFIDFFSKYFI